MTKLCIECHIEKDTQDFYAKRIGATGQVQYQSRCKVCHNEKSTVYQRAHPEKKSKAWYKWAKNHPEISKLDRHNRAQATASRKDWVRRNPERNRVLKMAAAHRRKARKTGAGGSFTASEWICLKSQFDNCCVACGRSDEQLKVLGLVLAADHILPLSKGGTSNIENIQPLCHGTGGCNNKKGATYVDYRLSALRR